MSILQEALDNLALGGGDVLRGHIWTDNASVINAIIREAKTAEELLDLVDRTFMYAINFPPELANHKGYWTSENDQPRVRQQQIAWLVKNLERGVGFSSQLLMRDPSIEDSPFGHWRNKTTVAGRRLSGNFLRTWSIYCRIERFLGQPAFRRVLELGAGAGHQARTILLLQPDCRYVIVDLPETLLFSYCHLRLSFPEKKILYVKKPEDYASHEQYDIVLVPAQLADVFRGDNFSLFLNTASMGEMPAATVRWWMLMLQHEGGVNVQNLYTLNRYLNQTSSGWQAIRDNENESCLHFDAQWEVKNWELEPDFCRCPFIDTLHARYLEIAAFRLGYDPNEVRMAKADELLDFATGQDWSRGDGGFATNISATGRAPFTPDLTMGGTLFALWESLRLWPRSRTVAELLRYLPVVTRLPDCEEGGFYRWLQQALLERETGLTQ